MVERLEGDYFTALRSICNKVSDLIEMREGEEGEVDDGILHMEAELKHLEAEENKELKDAEIEREKSRNFILKAIAPGLGAKEIKKIRRKRNNKKSLLVEQILIQLTGGLEGNLETFLSDSLGKLSALGFPFAMESGTCNAIRIFKSVHEIRLAYSKQCFVGFVGPQNAGKSTLLNKLFGKAAETGFRTHTAEPTRYNVAENVYAIDFPGLDSLEDHRSRFAQFGQMSNLFI